METRIGLGSDLHRLVKGVGIRLGAVDIACDYSVLAVSDGDVLLHALVDALLGALGKGDIGEHFPESLVTKGQDSRLFVAQVMEMLRQSSASIINADCIIDLEKPKLQPWKLAIRQSLADLLSVPIERVNIKAKTAEGCGAVGKSEAISAQVAVLLQKG